MNVRQPTTAEEIYADVSRRNPLIIGRARPHQIGEIIASDAWAVRGSPAHVILDPPIRFMVLREVTRADYLAAVGHEPAEGHDYFYEVSTD